MYFQSDTHSFTLQNQIYVCQKNQGNYLSGERI